jgi:two-component system NtrC family sensor kinase
MRWLRTALSLRVKITATFTLIVVGGTVASTLIGSQIITNALLSQARTRGLQGLEAARTIYSDQLGAVKAELLRASTSDALEVPIQSGSADALPDALVRARDAAGLSFLGYVDARRQQAVRAGGGAAGSAITSALRGPVGEALNGRAVASTEALDLEALSAENPALADEAIVARAAPAGNLGESAPALTSGLVLFAAVPVRVRGVIVGALYGGTLLNNRTEIVDRVELLLYGGEKYRDRQLGTISILLGDVWISTNVTRAPGVRATGTVMSPDIAGPVLSSGRKWSGRASVLDDWYVASCEPIRSHSGKVVGALYVAILEAPLLAARTEVMRTFLVVCLVGLVVVFALTYVLTRTMIHPLEEMVAATKRIAAGDLDVSVNVASRDEVGELAGSFNLMLASLKTMNGELQEWAHTLEEKVRDRTAELVSVQARMVQSEKLASIGRLAAGVAHGINNPLGGILSLTMLALEDMPADHPLRADLDTIVKQTLRCRDIVKGLLDFSRQSDAQAAMTDVTPVIDSTLALLERQPVFQNIKVTRLLEPNLPPVLIDPGQLQEIIVNLVLNGVDAMEEHGGLTVESVEDEAAGEIVIRVTDSGKGIPPEVMPFLFEPFFTTKKVGRGTGLGLAIVHGVVTRAGGRVEAVSAPGATTFTLRLPKAERGGSNGPSATTGPGAGQSAGR